MAKRRRLQTMSPLAEQTASAADLVNVLSAEDVPARNIPSGMREVEITPEMRERVPVKQPGVDRAEQVARFKTGARGQALGEGVRRLGRNIRTGAGAVRDAGKDVADVLATQEGQMFAGQMGAAFGQGDPTSPATILGEGAMQMAQERASGDIMARLLSGEDISDIPAEELALAGDKTRQQVLNEQARREEMEMSEEELQIRERQQERALDLRDKGLDLQAYGLELQEDELGARLNADEFERRLAVAERNAAAQESTANSLVRLREAQIEAMQNPESSENVDRLNMERRNLIENYGNYVESEQERIRILEDQLTQLGRTEGERHMGIGAATRETLRRFREGDFETPASEFTKIPASDDYLKLKGRVAEAKEQLDEHTKELQQLIKQQSTALGGGEQAELPEAPAQIEGEQAEGEQAEIQTVTSSEEVTGLPDGAVFESKIPGTRLEGRILRKSGNELIDVTDQFRQQ